MHRPTTFRIEVSHLDDQAAYALAPTPVSLAEQVSGGELDLDLSPVESVGSAALSLLMG